LTASGEHHSVGRSAEQFPHRRKALILGFLKTIEHRLAGFARVMNFVPSLLDKGPKGSGKLSVERFDVQDNIQIFGGPKLKSRLFHRQRRGRTAN
jgi:hypothetical protein